ncbi:sulfur carrier protein ThiS [Glutamicibacter sp.]|uniref:sulfur carrier protein ThiS n=1 Tax=Glutamicibacter sp. TaxID=1931995 RepID=UPI0028BF3EB9|nr:sulfur carrier protein ThiS [Glutamicibacter sp.]
MNTIAINFNSQPTQVPEGTTLRQIIAGHIGKELNDAGQAADGSKLGIAAAVNGAVVPRSGWAAKELAEGCSIELVTAAQGG